ncbi:MAG: chromosome partitioning protein ParB [Rhizobacter sp.]|nr:chromosome partitioning protein ParB [Burkholderiales bacterium]
MTVGYAEVEKRRGAWQLLAADDRKPYLFSHYFPAVLGPKSQIYIVDHHHLGLALLQEGVERTHVTILRDLSGLTKDEFWTVMDHHQWVHTYDAQGRRQDVSELPKRLTGLQDDPYRSLAGEARQAGAYAKDHTPFAEFLWADFFRRRISVKATQLNSSTTLQRAVELARSPAAEHLPGWSGASS